MYHKKAFFWLLAFPFIFISVTACTSIETSNTSVPVNSTRPPIGETIPPPTQDDRGNPKLEYVLVELIRSEERGEAESFAKQNGLNLQDNNVLVTVYCLPGQAEIAANATINVGGRLASSYSTQKLFDAWVPIKSLDAVANEKSIQGITGTSPAQLDNP